jgi:putative transposase
VIVTAKLKSCAAAKREILPSVERRQSRYPNNRAEVSHQLTRQERLMKRIKSSCAVLSLYPQPDPQPLPVPTVIASVPIRHYTVRDAAFRTWREVADAPVFPLMWLYAVTSYSVFIGEVRPTAGHH